MNAPTKSHAVPSHVPVLLYEVVAALDPKAGEVHVDGTFGAGGYARAILAAGAAVTAFDRDPDAIAEGRALADAEPRLTLVADRFANIASHVDAADGVHRTPHRGLAAGEGELTLDGDLAPVRRGRLVGGRRARGCAEQQRGPGRERRPAGWSSDHGAQATAASSPTG